MKRSEEKSEERRRKLVELSLRYLHRVPVRMARKMAIVDQLVKIDGGDMALLSGKKHYWLPKDVG